MDKIININGLEKRLKLNKEPELKDLLFPVVLSNMYEKYSKKLNVIECIYKNNIPTYAKINCISIEDAKYNINLVREVQGLDKIK